MMGLMGKHCKLRPMMGNLCKLLEPLMGQLCKLFKPVMEKQLKLLEPVMGKLCKLSILEELYKLLGSD